jgi:hypothetical protein
MVILAPELEEPHTVQPAARHVPEHRPQGRPREVRHWPGAAAYDVKKMAEFICPVREFD